MGVVNALLIIITYIIFFMWVVFTPQIENMPSTPKRDQDNENIISDLRKRLELINVEKYCLGQSIINGIWSAKSKETKTSLAKMLVELLSSSGEG